MAEQKWNVDVTMIMSKQTTKKEKRKKKKTLMISLGVNMSL
jgi:hypothetical protein